MSKTYKRIPYGYFRDPKGHKKYLMERTTKDEGVPALRYRAIPPDPWDDVQFDRQVWIPYQACGNMVRKGLQDDLIIRKLVGKFHITSAQAEKILKWKKR